MKSSTGFDLLLLNFVLFWFVILVYDLGRGCWGNFFRTEKKDRILELGFELLVMWAGFYLFIYFKVLIRLAFWVSFGLVLIWE